MQREKNPSSALVYVVGGEEDSARVNKTLFFDEKFGDADGLPETPSRPYRDVSDATILTDPAAGDGYVLQFAPGTYHVPDNLAVRVSMIGASREAVTLIFNGMAPVDGLVYIKEVTVDGDLLILRSDYLFNDCNIFLPIQSLEGTKVTFQDCVVTIGDGFPAEGQSLLNPGEKSVSVPQPIAVCIQSYIAEIVDDPYRLPLKFMNCVVRLRGNLLIQGAVLFNCEIPVMIAGEGEAGIIFSALFGCNSGDMLSFNRVGIRSTILQDSHFATVTMGNGREGNEDGGIAIGQCIMGNTSIDVIEAGAGYGSGNGGHCMEFTNVANCYFLALISGSGGNGQSGGSPGNGGHIFYNCFNLSDNYVEFIGITGDAGDNGVTHGIGGSVVYTSLNETTVTNLTFDTVTRIGRYGKAFHTTDQDSTANLVKFRQILLQEGGGLVNAEGLSTRMKINDISVLNMTVISNSPVELFEATAETVGVADFGLTIAIVTCITAAIGLITSLVAGGDGLRQSDSPLVTLFKVNRSGGEGNSIVQGVLTDLTVSEAVVPHFDVISAENSRSRIRSDNIIMRNVRSEHYTHVKAISGGEVTITDTIIESTEFSPMEDPVAPTGNSLHYQKFADAVERRIAESANYHKFARYHSTLLARGHRYLGDPGVLYRLGFVDDIRAFFADGGGLSSIIDAAGVVLNNVASGAMSIARTLGIPVTRKERLRRKAALREAKRLGRPLKQDDNRGRLRISGLTSNNLDINSVLRSRRPARVRLPGRAGKRVVSMEERRSGKLKSDPAPFISLMDLDGDYDAWLNNFIFNDTTVVTDDKFSIFHQQEGANSQCGQFQYLDFDFMNTPPESRIIDLYDESELTLTHTNLNEIETPAVEQIDKDPQSDLYLRYVFVDTDNNAGTGQYTDASYIDWPGTTQG